jgi:hypothetical protein
VSTDIVLPVNGTGTPLDSKFITRNGTRQVVNAIDRGAPTGHGASRQPSGEVLFYNDFRTPVTSVWDDGLGSASRDTTMMFCGLPSLKLWPQTQSGTANTVAAPTSLGVTPVGTGGSFTANTYFWKVTAHNNVGETVGSNEVSAAIVNGGSASLTWTGSTGAALYKIYRSTTTNTELLVGSSATTNFTDTGTAGGAAIPVSGTTQCPGRTAATTGVVAKQRILDGYTGKYGIEGWFRMTSTNMNSATTVFPIIALYNRDGTSAWHSRVWLNPMGNNLPMQAWILNGAATAASNGGSPLTGTGAVWTSVATSVNQNGAGSHTYYPPTGGLDKAGGWHHVKLVVDMANKTYVSIYLDGAYADLSAYALDQTTSAGAAMMHFSVELMATTATDRYMHWNRLIATSEV